MRNLYFNIKAEKNKIEKIKIKKTEKKEIKEDKSEKLKLLGNMANVSLALSSTDTISQLQKKISVGGSLPETSLPSWPSNLSN